MTTPSQLQPVDWSRLPRRQAISAADAAQRLVRHPGWAITGDGARTALEKTYHFANYFQTLAFVNALAWIAHQQDHHPSLQVEYGRCTVRWNTHDAGGISDTDFDCAQRTDTLVSTL
ncbi:MAG: 4a-hydroxytetrahydrobiopterin dehydratase [Comamonas sp.]